MLQVGEQQFLVLLLVLDADLEPLPYRRLQGWTLEQAGDPLVDLVAPGLDPPSVRQRYKATLGPWMPVADIDVVAVEQDLERRVEGFEARLEALRG